MNHNTMEMASENSKGILHCEVEERAPKRSQRCSPRSHKPPGIYAAKPV